MSTKAAVATIAAISKISNVDLWNAVRKFSPTFASHTSKGTKELFTEQGFAELTTPDASIINEFFQLSVRVALNVVNISHAKDPLAEAGFGETFDQPFGGITQRMAVNSVKPVTPAYVNLQNGDSIDPFVIKKPEVSERFYTHNFNYQSLITIQDFNIKQIFISEYGVSEMLAGIMEGLQNGWILQKYGNKLETINAAINDPQLKSNQQIGVTYGGEWTDDDLREFILKVKDIVSMMTVSAQSSAFNMAGFASTQDKGRLKLLVRAGYKNALDIKTLAGTFNPDRLNIGVDVQEVEHFGGIYYQLTNGTRLYPAYDKLGTEIGLNEAENQSVATHQKEDADVQAIDPNADVVAILADKGFLFETIQNSYTIQPIYNPRGMYTNQWANCPNNGIHYDRNYNFVVFKAAT